MKAQLATLAHTHATSAALAGYLASFAQNSPDKGLFVGFSGPLGVGKTELIRELLHALGVGGDVTSPTFVFECFYDTAGVSGSAFDAIVHWDLYRWTTPAVPQDFFDYRRTARTLVLVEWPERCTDLLDLLDIRIMLAFAGSAPDGAQEHSEQGETVPREIEIIAVQESARAGAASRARETLTETLRLAGIETAGME